MTQHRPALPDAWPSLVAGLGGGMVFLWIAGPHALDPRKLDWMLHGDWAQTAVGFEFFRRAQVGFPLGIVADYLHPLGSSLGYQDGIPWVGLVLRPLAPLLPVDFQFLGPWLFGGGLTEIHLAAVGRSI